MRTTLQEYVEIQKTISAERRELAMGRQLLQEQIEVVNREIESLREELAKTQEEIDSAGNEHVELTAELEGYNDANDLMAGLLLGLEERLRALVVRLPEHIQVHIQPLIQRLPRDPAEQAEDAEASEGEEGSEEEQGVRLAELPGRFSTVTGILNEVNRLHQDISLVNERRELPGGSTAEVSTLYFGLAQGFYATANGSAAGVGTPAAEGWTWSTNNESAAAVLEAIQIHQGEKPAAFVQLPVSIQ